MCKTMPINNHFRSLLKSKNLSFLSITTLLTRINRLWNNYFTILCDNHYSLINSFGF
jgi:hypothetical protein